MMIALKTQFVRLFNILVLDCPDKGLSVLRRQNSHRQDIRRKQGIIRFFSTHSFYYLTKCINLLPAGGSQQSQWLLLIHLKRCEFRSSTVATPLNHLLKFCYIGARNRPPCTTLFCEHVGFSEIERDQQ